jgi:hypothetical protein
MMLHIPLLSKRGEVPVLDCRDFVIHTELSAGADRAIILFMNPPLTEYHGSTIQALLPPPDR